MARSVTFLQLASEFGGTKFGPFTGVEIRLGSDPTRNDITLPESLGVAREHIKVLRHGEDNFILAPVERSGAVFLWREGSKRPKQVATPVAISPGDGFSLVTPEGPRFYLRAEMGKEAAKSLADDNTQGPLRGMAGKISSRGILEEIKRVGFAKAMTTGMGRTLGNGWRMVKTGAIFSPMYIVMGMGWIGGGAGMGGMSCKMMDLNKEKASMQASVDECQDQLGGSNDGGEGGLPELRALTQNILDDREWESTLETDRPLYNAYKTELNTILSNFDQYDWVIEKKGSQFAKLIRSLEKTGMATELVRVMAYTAAPKKYRSTDWRILANSDGDDVCGRGPMSLTYRQGHRMNLTIQQDALVDHTLASGNDLQAQQDALNRTAAIVDYRPDPEKREIKIDSSGPLSGNDECIFMEGDDDRSNPNDLGKGLDRALGENAPQLPGKGKPYWIASRVAKLYAMDCQRGYDSIQFKRGNNPPSTALDRAEISKDRVEWVLEKTGKVLARSVAIPCMASLQAQQNNTKYPKFLEPKPNVLSCIIVSGLSQYKVLEK